MNEEEKEGDARSKSQLGAWRIDVVKSWCVQSGNWLAPRVVRAQEQGELWRAIPQIFTYRDTGADLEFGLGVEESDSPFRLASPAPTAELRCVQLTACDEAADSSTAISKRARGYGSVSSKDSSGVPGVVPPRRILGTAWKARLHVYRNGSLSAW
jgi:hypothetical protein